ncbi:2-iminoacetate synthase ThiH, partial [Campylobacter upsaliensis]
ERMGFRDEAVKLGVSKMSAGVSVGIGEHSGEKKGDEQFEISDDRSVEAIRIKLKELDLQPVMSDSIYVG